MFTKANNPSLNKGKVTKKKPAMKDMPSPFDMKTGMDVGNGPKFNPFTSKLPFDTGAKKVSKKTPVKKVAKKTAIKKKVKKPVAKKPKFAGF